MTYYQKIKCPLCKAVNLGKAGKSAKFEEGQPCEVTLKPFCQEVELDEQLSFVGKESNQRWIWLAVEHSTNTVLAYVFGRRKDVIFKELKALLKPLMIGEFMNEISL